jgi:16S rRNA (guanine966-N2)-methyltransferase
VREAVFSSVESHAGLEGATVADLFAGSGALGIEALSRGAACAVFVERDARAAAVIAVNLAALGIGPDRSTVRRTDALAAASTPEVARTDVVFADPPYAFPDWPALLDALATAGPPGLVVVETGTAPQVPPGWSSVRQKTYGSTVVTMLRPPQGPGDTGATR